MPTGRERVERLAERRLRARRTFSGRGSSSAIVVAGKGPVLFDAGRAAQSMLLAAWAEGIASCPNGIGDVDARARRARHQRGGDARDRAHLRLSRAAPRPRASHGRGMERAGEPETDRRRRAPCFRERDGLSPPRMKGGLDLGGTKIQAVVTDGEVGRARERAAGDAAGRRPRVGDARARGGAAGRARRRRDRADGNRGRRRRRAGLDRHGVGHGVAGRRTSTGGTRRIRSGRRSRTSSGGRCSIGNDVNVAVEAERRFGAGRGFSSFLGVFWGTGVGGGIVIDGRRLVGRGSAGEIGHVCSKPGGRRCNCGLEGCVEAYAGRGALEDRAREVAKERQARSCSS